MVDDAPLETVRRTKAVAIKVLDVKDRRALSEGMLPQEAAKSEGWLKSDLVSGFWRKSDQGSRKSSPSELSVKSRRNIDRFKTVFHGVDWFKSRNTDDSDQETEVTDDNESSTYTAALYNKLSSMFDGFKGMMYTNWKITRTFGTNTASAISSMANGVPNISQRFSWNMESFLRSNSASERFIAFIPSFSSQKSGYTFSDAFIPNHGTFVDCFALFIEDPPKEQKSPDPVDAQSVIDVGNNLRCEIVSKASQRVLSEHGPYQCVFEENINTETEAKPLKEFIEDMPVHNGRLRFFQAIKSLRKPSDKNIDNQDVPSQSMGSKDHVESMSHYSPTSYIKNRVAMFSEYLSKRSEEAPGPKTLRSYFANLRSRRGNEESEDNDESKFDDNAHYRMQEHTMIHTGHWDEFQYDNIEIVLRDDNNDSVIQLPYGCAVM
ncbi:hypothetical protein BBOV_III008140 [Babesia bovis T2Bo]|uniref:Uncharacterized protein n=1 Tax=Babesia bovis TaxID=5865 RepID=A7AP90_BABBO|nr:hypothetical protein BBOV_III008140 [Babesia bovis T2Bo]EDO08374.1 hypothetical protein BBOV_III008140 [Babesia bovis T2Bo]|eukprot:XP_001611942.1 hypothetical protein [Babesia bovis T2Bo]